jgi:cysteine desulfurase family protein (TIGR01976 family)
MDNLDLDFVRAQFPALSSSPWVLFDNAGGSLAVAPVIERLTAYMRRYQMQLGASYGDSVEAAARVRAGREAVARWINSLPEDVVIGPTSTALVQILARALEPLIREGDEIIVTNLDHEANIGPWRALQERGVAVREWRFSEDTHRLEIQDLEPLLSERTRLVCFCHVSNIVGSIHDVKAICQRIHQAGALACVDGVAFAPHRQVDVQDLDVDFYFLSLYKTYGPHLGVLYGRRDLLTQCKGQYHFFMEESYVPEKLEPGNVNYELTASLPGLLDYRDQLLEHHGIETSGRDRETTASFFALLARREEELVAPLLNFLGDHARTQLVGDLKADRDRRVPTVSFSVPGTSSKTIVTQLDSYQLATRFGHFYAYRCVRDLGLLEQDGVIRISMLHYNSDAEVKQLVAALSKVLREGA